MPLKLSSVFYGGLLRCLISCLVLTIRSQGDVQSLPRFDHPIFIVGTERSGSNLVRVILNAHSSIHMPHPPHIFHFIGELEEYYGDLKSERSFRRMISDVLLLARRHIFPWKSEMTIDSILGSAEPRDLMGVFGALYRKSLADHPPAKRWGCKSTFMIHHVERILLHWPHAKIIFLVRDVRDVVVSSRKSVFNPFDPVLTAELWSRQQALGLSFLNAQPSSKKMLLFHYEKLLEHPRLALKELCSFLGEPFEEQMLHFYETKEAKKGASLSASWKNTAQPLMKNNTKKYLTALTPRELQMVEAVAIQQMEALGYTPESAVDQWAIDSNLDGYWSRLRFNVNNWWLWAHVEWVSLFNDRNHWQRWTRDWTVFAIRSTRWRGHGSSL